MPDRLDQKNELIFFEYLALFILVNHQFFRLFPWNTQRSIDRAITITPAFLDARSIVMIRDPTIHPADCAANGSVSEVCAPFPARKCSIHGVGPGNRNLRPKC